VAAELRSAVEARRRDLLGRRRHFHAQPELAFQEKKTAAVIADHLKEWGFEVQTGVAQTGVVANLRGTRPGRGVLVRADMDGLPIKEEGGLPFRSLSDGVMHACGHDVHMAIALTLADLLAESKADLPGLVRFVFQPAEEVAGGARPMIEAGVLEGIDRVLGLHVWAGLEVGLIGVRPGPMWASADQFQLTVHGRGGHGAMPQLTVDPVVAAAQVVTALQALISREIAPADPAVLTLGTIEGGTAHNVVASSVVMTGTVRAFDKEVRDRLLRRIPELAEGIAKSYRGFAEFNLGSSAPPLVNDASIASLVAEAAGSVSGVQVTEFEPLMVGEDFACFLEQRPGCFFLLGGAPADGPAVHHTGSFRIDERCLGIGLEVLAAATLRLLQP
jgi:amidohydrolase